MPLLSSFFLSIQDDIFGKNINLGQIPFSLLNYIFKLLDSLLNFKNALVPHVLLHICRSLALPHQQFGNNLLSLLYYAFYGYPERMIAKMRFF